MCFESSAFLDTAIFEEGSQLQRIDSSAFFKCGLKAVVIPRSVETVGGFCFACCANLESVVFEPPSKLKTIDRAISDRTLVKRIVLPLESREGFVADEHSCQLEIVEPE
jgi:hypothetical protein